MKFDYNMMATTRFQSMMAGEQLKSKINIIKYLTNECNEIDGGYLYIRHRDGRINFIEYRDGRHLGITRNMERVYELARRDYMKRRIEYLRASAEIGVRKDNGIRLQNAERALRELLKKYSEAHLDLRKIIFTKVQYEWQSEPQSKLLEMASMSKLGFSVQEENLFARPLMYMTDGGVMVRSKEEQAIGSMMEAMGIAYRYEPLVEIGGSAYYPSFAVMMENNRLILIEYVGEGAGAGQSRETVERLVAYKEANIEIGRDVFLAFGCDADKSYKLVVFLNQVMSATPGHNNVLSEAVNNNRRNCLKN